MVVGSVLNGGSVECRRYSQSEDQLKDCTCSPGILRKELPLTKEDIEKMSVDDLLKIINGN